MRFLFCALCLLSLAACGVDGAPIKPTGGLGIGISPRGVTINPNAGVKVGPVKLGISL